MLMTHVLGLNVVSCYDRYMKLIMFCWLYSSIAMDSNSNQELSDHT